MALPPGPGDLGAEGSPLWYDLDQAVARHATESFGHRGTADTVLLGQRGNGGQGLPAGPLVSFDPAAQVSLYTVRRHLPLSWHNMIIAGIGHGLRAVYTDCIDYYCLY
jgi:hypothetical protein